MILPYVENLKRLGISATVRVVDSTEQKRREDNFDFDIVVGVFPESDSPGNEQRDFWTSAAADQPGARNIIGIKNRAVDALVDKIIFAPDRDALVAACRAGVLPQETGQGQHAEAVVVHALAQEARGGILLRDLF